MSDGAMKNPPERAPAANTPPARRRDQHQDGTTERPQQAPRPGKGPKSEPEERSITEAARDLAALVSYQEAAIVSRVLLAKPEGSVTLFAFDKGQRLSEHQAPFDALAQVVEGRMEITIAGKIHDVRAGQIILMPAHISHALAAPVEAKMLLTMIKHRQGPD